MFQPSQYANLTADEIVRTHVSELMRARVITVLIVLACGAGAFASMFTLLGVAQVVGYLVFMALMFTVPFMFITRYMNKHFFGLRSILLQDCDAEKYCAVIEGIVPRGWLNGKRRPVFICEFAMARYYLGEFEQALELLSRMHVRSRKSVLHLQAAQIDIASRCCLGDRPGAAASYRQALTWLADVRRNEKNQQLLADIQETMEFTLSDPAAWGDSELAAIEQRVARAETRAEWAAWLLRRAKWELVHGDASAARATLEPLAEGPLVPIAKRELEVLRAEAGAA